MCKFVNLEPLTTFFFSDQPKLYAQYSWAWGWGLLGVRALGLVYLSGFYVYDLLDTASWIQKIIYLTDVTYFFTWLYFLTVLQARFFPIIKSLDQYCEILFQITFCSQVFVVVAYWSIIFPNENYPNYFKNLSWHGLPLFFLLLDFLLNGYRFLPKQFVAFLVFAFVYLFCINLPYSLVIQPVYREASDWVSWITYVFIVGAVVVAGLVWGIGRVVYLKLKKDRIQAGMRNMENKVNAVIQLQQNINNHSQTQDNKLTQIQNK